MVQNKKGTAEFDLKEAISPNRLIGLWRLMRGFQLDYTFATLMQGLSAASKTATYLLLSYFVDNYFLASTGTYPVLEHCRGVCSLCRIAGVFHLPERQACR